MLLQVVYKNGRVETYQGVFDFYVDGDMFNIDLEFKGELTPLEIESDKIEKIDFAESYVLVNYEEEYYV